MGKNKKKKENRVPITVLAAQKKLKVEAASSSMEDHKSKSTKTPISVSPKKATSDSRVPSKPKTSLPPAQDGPQSASTKKKKLSLKSNPQKEKAHEIPSADIDHRSEFKANEFFNAPDLERGFTTYTCEFLVEPEQKHEAMGVVDCAELATEFSELKEESKGKYLHDICWSTELSSTEKARKVFEWMIAPVSVEDFYEHFWEQRPLHIKNRPKDFYNVFSSIGHMNTSLNSNSKSKSNSNSNSRSNSKSNPNSNSNLHSKNSELKKKKKKTPSEDQQHKMEECETPQPTNDYFSSPLFSRGDIEQILQTGECQYGVHLDVTKYSNGKRLTLNPTDPKKSEAPFAENKHVWQFFGEGCSVRMLHPQQWHENLWMILSTLEEFFGCVVGCNTYLTPKKCQGFSPHYDDVEAFALQTEGAKRWKLYEPLQPSHKLCRYSSRNFEQKELPKPLYEFVLETGDLVYFPRGYVHQCISVNDRDSHHVTLSTGLKNTWYDFLELALPQALSFAFEDDIEFRRSLPRDSFQTIGLLFSEKETEARENFRTNFLKLYDALIDQMPLDTTMDELAARFLFERIRPHPCLIGQQKPSSKKQKVTMDGKVRLAIQSAIRTSSGEETVVLYSPMKNERQLHAHQVAEEIQKENFKSVLELPLSFANPVEHLISVYPDWISVVALPFLDSDEQKLQLAKKLVESKMCVYREK